MSINRIAQPDFWLEIRKEYIIENFEKLLYYIRRYQYLEKRDSGNGEFLTTCRYLVDLAEELSEFSLKRSFVASPEFKLSESDMVVSDTLAFRIMVAAIIASQKIGKDQHVILARLINLLVTAHKMPYTDIADDLIYVISNCIIKSPIIGLGMNWNDIDNPDQFSPNTLLHNICRTRFDTEHGVESVFEGKGTVVFSKEMVMCAPVNKTDFLKGGLVEYLSIGKNMKVLLPKSDHMRSPVSVDDVFDGMTFMTRAQGGVKPSAIESKRKYSAGMVIPVTIKSSWGVKVEAVSVDPEYETVAGKININLQETLRYADIFRVLSFFNVGRVLLVEYIPDDKEFCFALRGGFNQVYHEFADQMRGESLPGVYIGDYSAGTQWLTEDGFVVNVMGKVVNEDMLYAMEHNIPLTIRINGTKASNGVILINGSIIDDLDMYGLAEPILDLESYQHECFTYLFEQFINRCADYEPDADAGAGLEELDGEGSMIIGNVLMEHQRLLSDTMPRLICLQGALMLSIAAGDYTVSAYIRHELEYQISVARFAGGASPMSISLTHGPILDGIPEVEKHERIIAMIRNYKEPEIGRGSERLTTDENVEDTVDGLIDASNRLIGKIDDREISRIKFELARTLDVDDQFKSSDHTTYYGVESDTLEFKMSAVCPPKNKLKGNAEYEPDTQKWAILKTICGFLNSITGGELLIGVRDNGLAVGIARDCELLFEDRRIPEANSDRFRTYLKNIIDNSYIAYKSRVQKSSVTTAYITYNIEKNDEGLEILRIHVDSYRGDMVMFHPDAHRPEEIAESYIRTSGATVPMSHTVRDQTLLKKYHLAGDREGIGMAAIYEARNSKKRVLLKDYTSRSGVRDREIEVFQVFPESKCILAYDTALKDVRLFKSFRWKDARILEKNCTQSSSSKRDLRPDIFGFVFDPSRPVYKVEVDLTHYAAILLQEEYPGAESSISASGRKEYPWRLTLCVNSLEGIARFVRGLPNECHVEDGSDLHSYIL